MNTIEKEILQEMLIIEGGIGKLIGASLKKFGSDVKNVSKLPKINSQIKSTFKSIKDSDKAVNTDIKKLKDINDMRLKYNSHDKGILYEPSDLYNKYKPVKKLGVDPNTGMVDYVDEPLSVQIKNMEDKLRLDKDKNYENLRDKVKAVNKLRQQKEVANKSLKSLGKKAAVTTVGLVGLKKLHDSKSTDKKS